MKVHMKLAVSNIAWGAEDFANFLALLAELGCSGVELAPSLIWEDPIGVAPSDRAVIRRMIEDAGLETVGFHSLFYNLPDLQLFTTETARARLADYAEKLIVLCADLGGTTLVWGSPKNRKRGDVPMTAAMEIASTFFRRLASIAASHETILCIEPLGREETDFIDSCDTGAELVRRVDHPAFRLQLDAKAMIENGEDAAGVVETHHMLVRHVHVGDPGLTPPGSSGYDHTPLGCALRDVQYAHYVSIEMRRDFGPPRDVIRESVGYVQRCYAGATS